MKTFLFVFNDGNTVTEQKSMTLAQSRIWARDYLKKCSPQLLWVEIKEKKNSNTLYVCEESEYNLDEQAVALINKI